MDCTVYPTERTVLRQNKEETMVHTFLALQVLHARLGRVRCVSLKSRIEELVVGLKPCGHGLGVIGIVVSET